MIETEMTPVLRAPHSSGNSVTCDAREQARAGGRRAGSYPRSRAPDLGGNGVSSVTRKNEKLDKQKAKNKGWDEMNSVKRKKEYFRPKEWFKDGKLAANEWITSAEMFHSARELAHV